MTDQSSISLRIRNAMSNSFYKYKYLKQRWIAANPQALPEAIETALQRIAKKVGI